MDFICPELSNTSARTSVSEHLFISTSENRGDTFSDKNGGYTKIGTNVSAEGTTYVYAPTAMMGVFNQFKLGYNGYKFSNMLTALSIPLDENGIPTADKTLTYYFKISSIFDIYTNLYFLIYTNNALIVTRPIRKSTSKFQGVVSDSQIVSATSMNITDSLEYAKDALSSKLTVVPYSGSFTTSELNSITLKRRALNSQILFALSNVTVNPLDYVTYKGATYVIMSKLKQDDGTVLYQAVLEVNETIVTSGSITSYDAGYAKTAFKIGPLCHVVMNATQNLANNTWTLCNFNSVITDTDGGFNTTDHVFTAPASGYYAVSARITFWGSAVTGYTYGMDIRLGSSIKQRVYQYCPMNTAYLTLQGYVLLSLSAGDTVSIYGYQNTGSTRALYYGDAWTDLSIHMVRRV